MIATGEKGKTVFKRENWKEFFSFRVSVVVAKQYHRAVGAELPIPRGYMHMYDPYLNTLIYYVIPLYYLVKLFIKIRAAYFGLARFFEKRGMLYREECARYSNLWFLELRLPKKKYDEME